ncbi:4'-phosphopantetheinyl transferase superfamily protein [uncultured Microbulbifer sp.]|uniref:4'-phosphopantetheinyl transferase family protein n=1 Tax=uncultured Microbulbifer sp. TaxID=348147 RepID=UPI00262C7644|nr:4'-phosphopantetheinyl transferase superfamily protein [uncultured Microbulbifer sp.]
MTLPAVWLLHTNDIPPGSEEARALEALLSGDERLRRERYKREEARYQFLLSRALLRRVLGNICGQAPETLIFQVADSGKPRLAEVPELHFSLSHSGQWIALGVSCESDIGVDIEQPTRPRNFLSIARHYFHQDERTLLETAPPELLPVHFYRLWTMKEAFFKARGTGISEGLGRINLAGFHLGHGIALDASFEEPGAPWQFNYSMHPMRDGNHVHLALAGRDPALGELNVEQIHRGFGD